MSDPPRYDSTEEMTAVSVIPGPTVEQIADVERARREAQQHVETLVECPWCHGDGMVTPTKHATWLAKYLELGDLEP